MKVVVNKETNSQGKFRSLQGDCDLCFIVVNPADYTAGAIDLSIRWTVQWALMSKRDSFLGHLSRTFGLAQGRRSGNTSTGDNVVDGA